MNETTGPGHHRRQAKRGGLIVLGAVAVLGPLTWAISAGAAPGSAPTVRPSAEPGAEPIWNAAGLAALPAVGEPVPTGLLDEGSAVVLGCAKAPEGAVLVRSGIRIEGGISWQGGSASTGTGLHPMHAWATGVGRQASVGFLAGPPVTRIAAESPGGPVRVGTGSCGGFTLYWYEAPVGDQPKLTAYGQGGGVVAEFPAAVPSAGPSAVPSSAGRPSAVPTGGPRPSGSARPSGNPSGSARP